MRVLKGFKGPVHAIPFDGTDIAFLLHVDDVDLYVWSPALARGELPVNDARRVVLIVHNEGIGPPEFEGIRPQEIHHVGDARKRRLYELADVLVISYLADQKHDYTWPPEDGTRPRHIHDCVQCSFLGQYDFRGPLTPTKSGKARSTPLKADLYVCGRGEDKSLLARFSDQDGDYSSTLLSLVERDLEHMRQQPSTRGPALVEALGRYQRGSRRSFELQQNAPCLELTVQETTTVTEPADWPARKLFLRNNFVIGYRDIREGMGVGPMPGWSTERLAQWLSRDDTGKHPEIVRTLQASGSAAHTARNAASFIEAMASAEKLARAALK
jgi:hypothetical protein